MRTSQTLVDRLAEALAAGQTLLQVVATEEERALEVLGAAATRRGRPLYLWTSARGMGLGLEHRAWDASLAAPAAVLQHITSAAGEGLYALLDPHPYLADPTVLRRLRDLCAALAGTGRAVALVSAQRELPTELQADALLFELPLPSAAELGQELERQARRLGLALPANASALVRAGLGLTRRAFGAVSARCLVGEHRGAEAVERVLAEKEHAVRRTAALEFVEETRSLEGVGGLDLLKQWLRSRALGFDPQARAFGLPAPRGVLLVGVQGAGKSMAARATAGAWALPLLRLDVGALFGSLVGATEANLRQALVTAAALAPCVLWVDELERAFGGSSGGGDGGVASRVLGTFLTWMQERSAEVFVVATANDVGTLPPELLRKGRFDEVFFVDLPSAAERMDILSIHLRERQRDPTQFDLATLAAASDGYSGAELEQAVVEGLFTAFASRRPLDTGDLLAALEATVPLSRTMSESVERLRQWARGRARPASAAASGRSARAL